MALRWSFQRGWGAQAKEISVGGVWIFSGTTHSIIIVVLARDILACFGKSPEAVACCYSKNPQDIYYD